MLGEELRTHVPASPSPWQRSVVWAGLLLQHHVAYLRQTGGLDEITADMLSGDQEDLVLFLIAAALHERMSVLRAEQPVEGVALTAPRLRDGVTGTLACSPYGALVEAPAVAGLGALEQARLAEAATSNDPDAQLLWTRVHQAAYAVVTGLSAHVPPRWKGQRPPGACEGANYWERGLVMADVLLYISRAEAMARLERTLGTED
ncbi:hypothetical protein [Streptomyces indicus]|uniref:hypothetical protein n=1 Tax=Streptomyces indicus TaxID=417292 RepID=UPI00115FF288|nr:hypothetical protein [Streptomyces indicus]